MISAIKNYSQQERAEEPGDLATGLIPDFIMEKLAPEFYTRGVDDAHAYREDAIGVVVSIRK